MATDTPTPPPVEVHTTGWKHDYGDDYADHPGPSRSVPPPPGAPRCPEHPDTDQEGT